MKSFFSVFLYSVNYFINTSAVLDAMDNTDKSVEECLQERRKKIKQLRKVPVFTPDDIDSSIIRQDVHTISGFYHGIDKTFGFEGRAAFEEGRVRMVQQSPIDDLVTALYIFHSVFGRQFSKDHVFLDMGSNDGRAVAIAAALGYHSYGIEIDAQADAEAREYSQRLKPQVPSLERAMLLQGDYRNSEVLKQAQAQDADCFFNYDDGHVPEIAGLISSYGKQGAMLLVHSYKYIAGRVQFPLVGMIKHQKEKKYPPCFDVFTKPNQSR